MAEKLVPGIPYSTRIAFLQQTDATEDESNDSWTGDRQMTVLEQVMSRDSSRNEVTRKMRGRFLTINSGVNLDLTFLLSSPIKKLRG